MAEENYYLKGGPEDLIDSCDVLLSLDDGTQLPVQSQVLARCSPVFHGMVKEGIMSSPLPSRKVIWPFSECLQKDATNFLSSVYALRPHDYIDKKSALSIASLGDKYGVKLLRHAGCGEVVRDVLAGLAGIDRTAASMPSYLRNESLDMFTHILECAILFNMPKLLACCECHISMHPVLRLKPVSERLKHCLPASSAVRIARGLHEAFQTMAHEHAYPDRNEKCKCNCCYRNEMAYKNIVQCACPKQGIAAAPISTYLPSPREYLAMAQQ